MTRPDGPQPADLAAPETAGDAAQSAEGNRPGVTSAGAAGLATLMSAVLAACGGDDGGGSKEADGGLGAAGHWSAAQLCSLASVDDVTGLFPGVTVEEAAGIDDPDWSACLWTDKDKDILDPTGTLLTVSNRSHDGTPFSDSFEQLSIAGADQAVFIEDFGGPSAILVAVGDQVLDLSYPQGTSGARELAERIAAQWVGLQA